VGLYAAIAFHTAKRRRELGIRSALGGTPRQVLQTVLKHGLVLTTRQVSPSGSAFAAAIARTAGSLPFGVDPVDPVTYLAVAALLATLSLAASYLPARRASRAHPMAILRRE
jgi:ABC-type antimicrobial peptide transport system permease subunit